MKNNENKCKIFYFKEKQLYICPEFKPQNMSESEKKLVLTIKETADLLGVSIRTVWTLIEEKDLSTLKIRKTTKITREELERYIKEQQEKK